MPNFTPVKEISSYSAKEEVANTLTHGLGALFSLIALIFLLNKDINRLDNIRTMAFLIYGASLILLLLASTCYHAITAIQLKRMFKTIDHCAIYLLIAGTYTPLLLLLFSKPLSTQLLWIIWGLAGIGILFKVTLGTQYRALSLSTYLGMGFISLFIIKKLAIALPTQGFALLLSGGLLYSLGVIFYVKKTIPFNHAIWHVFVLLAAACHLAMMFYL